MALALFAPAAQAAPVTRIATPPPRNGWFVCDAVRGPYAVLAGKVANGRSVMTLLDRRSGRPATQSYDVGPADHGVGSVFWSLSQRGREAGAVRGINPGMVAGSDGIAPIRQVRIGGNELDCRWLGHMRFLGLDARRSVTVTEEGGRLVYRSYDFAGRGAVREMDEGQTSNVPTLEIAGGKEDAGGFRFANAGFTYRVERPRAGDAGTIRVTKAGRTVGRDRLLGSSWAAPGAAVPPPG